MRENDFKGEEEGRRRVAVEAVSPAIGGGRFPIKRIVGDTVAVEADLFCDGHDRLSAVLRFRQRGQGDWQERWMMPLGNDRWGASFSATALGVWQYTVQAWIDPFKTLRQDLEKKLGAGADAEIDLQRAAQFVATASARANGDDAKELKARAADLVSDLPAARRAEIALDARLLELMLRHAERRWATERAPVLEARVDPVRAGFGAWYELFPRSCAREPGRHGTFADCERLLPRLAELGFDVLYLPPIHPIGRSFRKGKNNAPHAGPGEPGSPWAIGSMEGGHKAIHPELGTLEDFRRLTGAARRLGMDVALDIAFQCSPDHPYVREHPEWFVSRPDGRIQHAENPPKKYEDIYPLNFESGNWRELWIELKSVFEFWIAQGVRIFRVDNPHTKAFGFWQWAIAELKARHPDLIFLAEAFTRPKVMYYLAKLGFTQSYNYFPWRNNRYELTEYFGELSRAPVKEFFRPSLWPNTPDILTHYLQAGGRAAFMVRLILAATLGANYGVYGPPYEVCENQARESGSEEYLNSEKYEIRHWDWDAPGSLAPLMAALNRIRREHPALQRDENLAFHGVDNDQMIVFSKTTADRADVILVVANLDPHHRQSGWTDLNLEALGLAPGAHYQAHDLLANARYFWRGARNFAQLDPQAPAHLFQLRARIRTEQDFDYYS